MKDIDKEVGEGKTQKTKPHYKDKYECRIDQFSFVALTCSQFHFQAKDPIPNVHTLNLYEFVTVWHKTYG